jgi:hypothetical protein
LSKDIYWYNSVDIFNPTGNNFQQLKGLPGYNNFKFFHNIFASNLSFTDRTKNIIGPIDVKIPELCAFPEMAPMNSSFEDICNQRAVDLMAMAKQQNKKIAVMYSGGIDSTLLLSSFISTANTQDIKDYLIVLMSELSINENPTFYYKFIENKLRCAPSHLFRFYLGNPDYMFVTGEGNDQLFGSAVLRGITLNFGQEAMHYACNRENIVKCLGTEIHNTDVTNKFFDIFSKSIDKACVEIDSIFLYFWWLNFTLKWQSVYMRIISYTKLENEQTIQPEINYFAFFYPVQFQLWSLNNTDKLVKNTWDSYKYVCKDIIYKLNPDANYRDKKLKIGSLARVIASKGAASAVYDDFTLRHDGLSVEYWNSNNDFI